MRLIVVEIHGGRSWSVVTQQKETVRLGDGEFGEHAELQQAAMDRTLLVCARFAELARAHGAADVVTVATAAVREAANRDAFVRRMRDEAGLHVRVVSGAEEARLIFLGVLSRVHVRDERLLVVDIGGGSTELAVGDSRGAAAVESMRLGAIRLTALEPPGDGPVPAAVYREHAAACRADRRAHRAAPQGPACRRRLRHLRHHREPRRRGRAPAARRDGGRGAGAGAQGPARRR